MNEESVDIIRVTLREIMEKKNSYSNSQINSKIQYELNIIKSHNNTKSLLAHAWMSHFFDIIGDKDPCSMEIHIEYCEKQSIYQEYVDDCKNILGYESSMILSSKGFGNLWNRSFDHVKIRQYKNVTGRS